MASIRKRRLTGEKIAWLCDYVDANGKRRAKQFPTRKAAEKWLAQTVVHIGQGLHTPDSASITISDAGELWLERCERNDLEVSTVRSYHGLLKHHIKPEIGNIKLSKLTAPAIERLIDTLLETRSRTLTKKIIGTLSMIIGDAQRRGLVHQNVVSIVRVKIPSREKRTIEIPTKEEVRNMVKNVSDKWRALLITALFTGLRASELRGLCWTNTDLDEAVLHVRQRVDQWRNFGPPKTKAGIRDVPLAPMVVSELKKWKLRCPVGELDLVFPNGAGKPESHANLLNRFFWPLQVECGIIKGYREKEGKKVALAKYSLHALRHAAASLLIEQGLNSKRIQSIMGHSSITVTMDTYGHLFEDPEEDKRIMQQVEASLFNGN